jgi:hypothetical protein
MNRLDRRTLETLVWYHRIVKRLIIIVYYSLVVTFTDDLTE